MKPLRSFVFTLSLLVAQLAIASDITLTDGRVFKDAVVISQSTGRVCIRHSGGLTQVEKYLLSGDLAVRFPADAAAVEREDARLGAAAQAAEQRRLEMAERTRRLEAAHAPVQRGPSPQEHAEALEWARMKQIREFVEDYARSYFERTAGASWSFSSGAEIEDPEPMSGWDNQWRVAGLIGTKNIHSTGGLNSQSRKFEAVVRWKNGRFQVIDFTAR